MRFVAFNFDTDKKAFEGKELNTLIGRLVKLMLEQGGDKISIVHEKRDDQYFVLGDSARVDSFVIRKQMV